MTKLELANLIAEKTGHPAETVKDCYNALIGIIREVVEKEETIMLTGLGKFYARNVKRHYYRDSEGNTVRDDESKALGFKPTRAMNDFINKRRLHKVS